MHLGSGRTNDQHSLVLGSVIVQGPRPTTDPPYAQEQAQAPFVLYRGGLHKYRAGNTSGRIHNPQQGST